MPKKPTSPAGHWLFPKRGRPYLVAEQLPTDSETLEASVVELFVARLRHLGHKVMGRARPDDWPDAAIAIGERTVGIELVEVVDSDHRQQVSGHAWYLSELRRAFAARGLDAALRGMTLELSDGYGGLPPARSGPALELVGNIAEQLADRREDLAASPLNVLRIVHFVSDPWNVSLFGARILSSVPDYGLRWNGAYMADPNCLARAVRGKLDQPYDGRCSFDELWLLAWDSFGYLLTSDRTTAFTLLDSVSHVFDRAWTCYLAGGPLVIVDELWPTGRS